MTETETRSRLVTVYACIVSDSWQNLDSNQLNIRSCTHILQITCACTWNYFFQNPSIICKQHRAGEETECFISVLLWRNRSRKVHFFEFNL